MVQVVVAENLAKIYGSGKRAVDGISFSLEQGEVFGFLGPNGSGKTTTIKLLNGILLPSKGSCRVLNIDPSVYPDRVHRFAGVVTEHAQMYDHLTGLQNLIFYGTAFGVSEGQSRSRAKVLLKKLELSDAADKKLGTYSTGMRQRLSLARAMIHRPKVLFLDEPTSGLDPESAHNVNRMIKGLAQDEGITVFLCTHQLRYAQEVCSSYGLIDNGRLLAVGTLAELRSLVFTGMNVKISTDFFPEGMPFNKTGERTLEIQVQSETEIATIVKQIVEQGGNVYHVSAHQLSLEEIYFSLLEKHKKREEVIG